MNGAPRPGTRRGRELAIQRLDAGNGRFNERMLPVLFAALTGAAREQVLQVPIQSLGGRYVRILAMRGTLVFNDSPATGVDAANVRMRIQLNGQEDLIGGDTNTASLAALFSDDAAPWFWFASPPRMRTGDILTITMTNTFFRGEGTPQLTPELNLWIIDDGIYEELYDRNDALEARA